MALMSPVFATSVLTLQEIIVMLREANSVRNIYARVQSGPTDKYVLLLNFSHLNGVALYACGKLVGHIELLHMLSRMYR